MGSFKNKINNKKKKKMEAEALNELIDLKKKMKEKFAAKEYVEAMDIMAAIAQHKKMDPEVMLMGATCYFMTGDTERAIKWVNNTLAYAPNNVGARILLGRICFTKDELDKGFEILSFVVDNQQSVMTDEEREYLLEILSYCDENMAEVMAKYQSVVAYYKANRVEKIAVDKGVTKAQAAVNRLKSLLNKSKTNKQDIPSADNPETTSVSAQKSASSKEQTDNSCNAKKAGEAAEDIINKVMNSNISLREKIRSLNNFAGGLYINGDYAGALTLLKQALHIDAHDPFVLKNMAYICLAMEDKDKALEYASAMPMVDFALLRSIKGSSRG